MGKIIKLAKYYKESLYVLLACILITFTALAFNKGEYYKYNYEIQSLKDCEMGWHEASNKICENYKQRQREKDDEEINNDGKINIPAKSSFDYVIFLASILQIVFIGMATFKLGASTKGQVEAIKKDVKKEKRLGAICKYVLQCFGFFMVIVLLTAVANLSMVIVNNIFTSNDFLRLLFEIVISLVTFLLGKKL